MGRAVGIIGAGGWGTALAKVLCEKGHQVTLWCHGEQSCREIRERRENSAYLPGILLPAALQVSRSIGEATDGMEIVVCAVPSHVVREVMARAASSGLSGATVVCGTKGLEEESLKTMDEVLRETPGGGVRAERLAFLSGPTFALEVARGLPAAVTIAARTEEVRNDVQETFSTSHLRVYTSRDVVGVQIGGAVKNVIAIAAGISDGLGLGLNARAALITRGLAEMTRLAVALGADPLTLAGLPGLGDLILTCTGELSRNRRIGLEIARGRGLEEIVRETRMVAEGVKNSRTVYLLARRTGAEMPIVEQMHHVLYRGKKPSEAVQDLMQRALKAELE